MLWVDVPVAFIAFDLLEHDGADIRAQPLADRRDRLAVLIDSAGEDLLRLSSRLDVESWRSCEQAKDRAREEATEGVMLKRRGSPYGVGRTVGDWWKWKVDPFTVDAVLIYAQRGHGKRAGLFTDYTFGVWDGDELVPVAKAYSGLTAAEIRQVDRHIQRTTITRQGPVRIVRPELVFELAFEGIQASDRHRSGIALRFPRMARWRHEKKPADADTLDLLRSLLERHGAARR
jgi:DNA ligase-1